MKEFFKQKSITIKDDSGGCLEFFMRPLKVKELEIVNRISILSETKNEDSITAHLLELVIKTLTVDAKQIPVEATNKLIDVFLEFNFDIKSDDKIEKKETDVDDKSRDQKPLVFYIEFLITQGHSFSDIMDYTIPQFNAFIDIACDRLSGNKKKMNPIDAFRRLGLPIQNRGNNDNGSAKRCRN